MLNAMTTERKIESLFNLSRDEIDKLKQSRYFCPACEAPVIIKNGQVKRPHFAHYKTSDCFSSSEGETEEHLALKEILVKWCIKEKISFEVEPYLAQLKQRPDLLIENLAIEIQCSPLSYKRMYERTQNYLNYGYTPIWILGNKLAPKKKFTESSKKFCYFSYRLGFYLWLIDWQKQEICLLFHIEEDWAGTIYYTSKRWPFFTEGLLAVFRYPEKAKVYSRRSYDAKQFMKSFYQDLEEKLVRRNKEFRKIQAFFYLRFQHILKLPYWFYYPGIRLFGSKGSDLMLKQKLWMILEQKTKNKFSINQVAAFFHDEIKQEEESFFYDFPNIKKNELEWICFNQLIKQWVECDLLIKENKCYQVNTACLINRQDSLKTFLFENKNKSVKTATPFKNMIR